MSNLSLKNSSIISVSDFNKIKTSIKNFNENRNTFLTPAKNRRYDELVYNNSLKLKNRIIEYDKTNNRLIKSDYEKDKEMKNKKILERAKREIEENLDEVKHMNSLMLSAQIASIRDKQIEERKKIEEKNKKYEDKLYLLCEIERLKDLNNREKFEKKLNEKKIEGKNELQKQILNNIKLKENKKKIVEKELENILKYQEKLKKEDEEKYIKQKEKAKKLIEEMLEANKKALEIKKNNKLKEIDEDKKIMEYNKTNLLFTKLFVKKF